MRDFFDRKTFDPINNNADKSTLKVLRTQGRIRHSKYLKGDLAQSTAMKWAVTVAEKPHTGVFLDLGCGDSPDVLIAAKLGFEAYGLDLFPPDEPTKHFIQADVADSILFPDDSIDVVVSQAMVDLIEPAARRQFFNEVKRVLKPDGVFACYLQWLESGWGFDLNEELLRAEETFGKIRRMPQGFVALGGCNE